MKSTVVAARYAKALFQLAQDSGSADKILSELRALDQTLSKEKDIQDFFASPLISPDKKLELLKPSLEGKDVSSEVMQFLFLLAEKNRLPIFSEVVEAYQIEIDQANGVVRGKVRSANALSPEERESLEATVARTTGKRVILNYEEDASVIGGLIAEVGSNTFDDTLTSHLRLMKEDLTRRIH